MNKLLPFSIINKLLPLSVLMLSAGIASAQYSIGTNAPDPSALYELNSNSKGLLIPRMTYAQRTAIVKPANGLLVYQTDNASGTTAGLYANTGTNTTPVWSKTGSGTQDITGGTITGSTITNSPISGSSGSFTMTGGSTSPNIVVTASTLGGALDTRPVSSLASDIQGNGLTANNGKIDLGGTLGTTAATISTGATSTGDLVLNRTTSGGDILVTNLTNTNSQSNRFVTQESDGTLHYAALSPSLALSATSPYSIGINTANGNTFTGAQTFNGGATANSLTVTTGTSGNSGVTLTNLTSATTPSTGQAIGVDGTGKIVTVAAAPPAWSLTGNSGTNPATNYLGTADNEPLIFKINGAFSGRISAASKGLTAFGLNAGNSTTTGDGNTALGENALHANITGIYNTGVGYNALPFNTTGHENIGLGHNADYKNVSGSSNIGIGGGALFSNTVGDNNVALGGATLYNSSGSNNTGLGTNALGSMNSGDNNTAVGYQALGNSGISATTSGNTAVGYQALGGNATGINNTAIGTSADVTVSNLSNATAIGYNAKVGASNSMVLGGTGADAVNVGIGITTPNAPLQFSNASVNRKIVFYEQANNDQQFYGLGINSNVLRYQVADAANDHVFYSGVNTTTSKELMRIKGNGNVGIGTNSPAYPLDVNGALHVGNHSSFTATGADQGAYLMWDMSGTDGETWLLNQRGLSPGNSGIRFGDVTIAGSPAAATLNEWARFNPSGYFGIGTTAPAYTLHVKSASTTTDPVQFENLQTLSSPSSIVTEDGSGVLKKSTVTSLSIAGSQITGTINNVPIGATMPATAQFTTLGVNMPLTNPAAMPTNTPAAPSSTLQVAGSIAGNVRANLIASGSPYTQQVTDYFITNNPGDVITYQLVSAASAPGRMLYIHVNRDPTTGAGGITLQSYNGTSTEIRKLNDDTKYASYILTVLQSYTFISDGNDWVEISR